jgi:DNA polymerase-3 subunit alpha
MQWIDSFIKRKHGKEEVSYLHSKLENSLSETYGIPVYQEQVMQIAKDIAGFSGPQADILRKAMGKKIRSLMMEQKKLFIEGAKENGFSEPEAKNIFALMEDFAQYGFNKSHAACYAMIAYWTAYLKTHFPNSFMAALLTSDQQNMDRVTIEAAEAERMGIEILPPDVNESFQGFAVVPDSNKIRFGLLAIKNVGEGPADAIVKERKANGPFKTVEDFINRLDSTVINKKPLEALIRAGALDSLETRGKLLANLEKLLLVGNKNSKNGNNGQTDMMSMLGNDKAMRVELTSEIEVTKKQIMVWEKELLGMYITEHPLKDYEDFLRERAVPIGEIDREHVDNTVIAGGVITNLHKILTRSKEMMIFATIEDTTGKIEVLVFPKMLQANSAIWQEDNVVLVKGRVSSNKDEEPKIVMEKVRELTEGDLENHSNNQAILITLDITGDEDRERFTRIKDLVQAHEGPAEVIIQINQSGTSKKVKLPLKVKLSEELKERIEELSGNKLEIMSF